jgi:hypothetical protein
MVVLLFIVEVKKHMENGPRASVSFGFILLLGR